MNASILALFLFGLASSQTLSCEIIDAQISAHVKSDNSDTLRKIQIIGIRVKQDVTSPSEILSLVKGMASRYDNPEAFQYVDIWFYSTKDVEANILDNHHTYARFTPNKKVIDIQNETWHRNSISLNFNSEVNKSGVEKEGGKSC